MSLVTKISLRKKYKMIKQQLLTKANQNSYHNGLIINFKSILSEHLNKQQYKNTQQLIIGSYINKPITQIIPPMLMYIENKNNPNKQIKLKYAYPYFQEKSKKMQFYEYSSKDQYQIGAFGVKVKVFNNPKQKQNDVNYKIDFVLVPLVAFTKEKQRIGQGGGYYDEFIKTIRQKQNMQLIHKRKTIFIGVGLQDLKIDDPTENIFHQDDQKLDYFITQKTIYS